jgi:hypothetical protein
MNGKSIETRTVTEYQRNFPLGRVQYGLDATEKRESSLVALADHVIRLTASLLRPHEALEGNS